MQYRKLEEYNFQLSSIVGLRGDRDTRYTSAKKSAEPRAEREDWSRSLLTGESPSWLFFTFRSADHRGS